MAKARLPKWGKQSGPGLFSEFEQRKEHLHQEVRVDKKGRTSHRWLANEQRKERKQARQEAQPGLFDSFTLPKQAPKRSGTPKAERKPEAPLFDFDFRAEKQAKQPAPEPEQPPGKVTWFSERKGHTPDSFQMTQDEYTAWNNGVLQVGSTKVVNGVTYKLNGNHRWERTDAAADARPQVTQAEYDADPDRYSPAEDTGEPYGLVNDGGRTVSGPVHITDRDRPLTISTQAGHLPIHRKGGRLVIEGLEDAQLSQRLDGNWEMRVGDRAKPVLLADNGKGNLRVLKGEDAAKVPEAAPQPPTQRKAKASAKVPAPDPHQPSFLDLPSEPAKPAAPKTEPAAPKAPSDDNKNDPQSVSVPQPQVRGHGPNYDQPFADTVQELPQFGFEMLEKATKSRRLAANQEAIALADRLIEEGRTPTAEERRVLAAYTGDGGTNGDLNAHYTPTLLAGAMWRLLARAGVTEGDVLEPSMGAGVFMETAPAGVSMHGVELSPVTQKIAKLLHGDAAVHDPMPFERFHTANPEQRFKGIISNPPYGSRYQAISDLDKPEIKQAERYFLDTSLDHLEDGGVGVFLTNPGPFESESARDFRARLLARAEVVGLYQLPQSTFAESDSGVPPVVAVLRKRPHADGMTVARLIEKHGEKVLEQVGWDDAAFMDGTLHLQSRNMLGEFTGKTLYRGYKDIQGELSPELLSKMTEGELRHEANHFAYGDRLSKIMEAEFDADDVSNARAYANAYGAPREGEIRDGLIFRNHRWHRLDDAAPELSDAMKISGILQTFADVRNNGQSGDAEAIRQDAEGRLNDFLEQHGNPHDHKSIKDAARHNHKLANLLTAVTKSGELAHHIVTPLKDENDFSDLVDRDDLHHVATYLHGKGRLNPEMVSQLWNGADTPGDAVAGLLAHPEIALTEDGRFVPGNTYFHGQVHDRAASLDAAAAAESDLSRKAKYEAQARRFREMLPRKTLEEFEVKPREKWIPTDVIQDFVNQVIAPGKDYRVTQEDGVFWVRSRESWDSEKIEDLRKYLNYAMTADAVRDQGKMSAADVSAARAANLEAVKKKSQRIEDQFAAWLSGSDHRDTVEDAYNRAFNSYVPENLSAAPLATESDPNYTGHALHLFQRQNVRFMMQQGGGITALDVGLGKTPTGIALVNELHLSGKAKKPMIIVPSPLLPNWRESITKAHADAAIVSSLDDDTQTGKRVLVIGQTYRGKRKNKETGEMEDFWADDSGEDVARKLVRAAHEDWHAILISRDWHSRIPLRPETWMDMVQSDIQKQRDFALDEDESDSGAYKGSKRKKSKGASKRDREQEKADALMKAAKKLFKGHTNPLNWEDLGVDAMIVDEAHAYKNLYSAPPTLGGKSPKFMGAGAESKRAQDFNYKSRHLRARNGGHGVYFLTATPTKNSPLEVFNMLSHITDAFGQRGIGLTEDFVDRYCQIEPRSVPQLDGTFESHPCVVGFKNLGELRGIMSQYVFRRTKDSEDVKALPGWHVPERDDIEQEFEMDDRVAAQYRDLADAAREASQTIGGFDESGKHVFSYLADMRKLTLDPALYDPAFAHTVNPRFKQAAEMAVQAIKDGGKTVMFMDLGQEKSGEEGGGDGRSDDEIADAATQYNIPGRADMKPAALRKLVQEHEEAMQGNAYDRLVQHLVNEGIPRERIAVVNGQTVKGKQERQEIKARFNAGELDVVVGSTPIIGEGFSLQRGTTDMVHLDTPWDPGTYQQRLGRAQRQGNKLASVRNHVLLAKNSFDAVTYSTMTGKQGWMQHLWDGTSDSVENSEASNNSLDDIAAMLQGDPEKYKELAAQRKAEAEARQEDAARKLTVDGVRAYGRKLAAVHKNGAQHQKMTEELEAMRAELPSLEGTKAQAVKDRIERYEGQLVKAATKLDRVRVETESARKQLLEDPRLTDQHRALIEGGKTFLLDEQGNPYVKGGTFMQNGSLRLVQDISTDRQAILHRRAVPDETAGGYMNKPVATPLNEVEAAKDHTLERTDEHDHHIIDGILGRDREKPVSSRSLARIHPDLATKHADYIHEALAGRPMKSVYGGLWTVKDGQAQYRPTTDSGVIQHPKVPNLEPGERLLLPTHEDAKLLNAALAQGENGTHKHSSDAPIATAYTPHARAYQVNQGLYDDVHKHEQSNHIAKAAPADLPRGQGLAAVYRRMKGRS